MEAEESPEDVPTPLAPATIRLLRRGVTGMRFFPTTLTHSEPPDGVRVVAFPPQGARQVSVVVGDGISVRDVAARIAGLWGETESSPFVASLAKAILVRSHGIRRTTPDAPYRLVDWRPGARLILPMDYSQDRRTVMLAPRTAIESIAQANARYPEYDAMILQRTASGPLARAGSLTRNDLFPLIRRNPPDANELGARVLAGTDGAAFALELLGLLTIEDLVHLAVAPGGPELVARFKAALGPGPAQPSSDPPTRARYMIAQIEAVIRESMTAGQVVTAALDDGTFRINPGDARVLRASIAGTGSIVVHDAIVELLASFARAGNVDVLSMYRRGESQHGVVDGSRTRVNAIDIRGIGDTQVDFGRLSKPAMVGLVAQMIRLLPDGDFDLGFPRPVGGPTGFDPPRDVFFSVPDLATARQCWDGTISRRLSQMLDVAPASAQTNIRAAMRASRARFHVLYPDGVDHLHINVTRFPNVIETP